ncbi:hypothetical protein TNCV_2848731 [Trichonephila clavipes]|nr:hypothetical protein TNCV_2848731 [Trichonephila clavipes]
MTCLPVAEVDIECDLGRERERERETSKAAVIGNHLDQGRYYALRLPKIGKFKRPAALFALRTVTHESNGFSPAESVYGNNLRTPVTLLYESWLDPEEKEDTVVEYVFELINRLKKCRDLATVRMEVRDRKKKWYDKNAIKREFQQGNAVLVLTLNQPHKLSPQWKGPEQHVETVAAAKFITLIDLTKGYWRIPLSPKAQKIAAFATSFGVYRPLPMPFGLKNAPYYFSKMMSEILNGCEKHATPYLDDIAIFSETWEEHQTHLQEILERLKKANLTIKPSKCKFAQQEVQYIDHVVGLGKRSPTELKIEVMQKIFRFLLLKHKSELF